ncbi:MAG: cytochrome C oxidase subunit IV family protein [Saprospiraceae bacterium]|nr:cytochrome C oxidase subunit IV family protein [Saprospiraceae bacterium]
MKDSLKYNVFTLALLVLLTASSGLMAAGEKTGFVLALTLAIAACVKVLLVVWQFMEMRWAHRAWLALVGLVLLVYLGLLAVLR